jgi:cytochrome c551/c552
MMKRNYLYPLFILTVSLAVAVGCGKKDDSDKGGSGGGEPAANTAGGSGGGAKSAAAAKVKAKQIFKQRCTVCHGANGQGDGPGAAGLKVKPQNYTDKEWQAKVTDEELKKAIVEGGAAVGKDPAMVPNPDLGKPENKEVLEALVGMIRDFGK